MLERQGRLVLQAREGDRHQAFQGPISRHAVVIGGQDIAVLVGKTIGEDEFLGRTEFLILTRGPIRFAIRGFHAGEIAAADARLVFEKGAGEIFRSPPLLEFAGLSQSLEERIRGCVDDS